MDECKCIVCNGRAFKQTNYENDLVFYTCDVCGRYQLSVDTLGTNKRDFNKLASYLIYHKYASIGGEFRYHTERTKEECDNYKAEFEKGNNIAGIPVHMDFEMIDAWYPKSFSEKMDNILLFFSRRMKHLGQSIRITTSEIPSILFMDRIDNEAVNKDIKWRDMADVLNECNFMMDCIKESGYIKCENAYSEFDMYEIKITAKGFERIDELQKNTSNGKKVLVAMKFGADTLDLREAIRKGIQEAGYIAIFIDEVQHNDFITPELLKNIRDSKFVVVDLSHKNNGAYFEEGYAMGLGKPVIQLCQQDVKLHFDIAQKNTIMWASESEIPMMLSNRIKATID